MKSGWVWLSITIIFIGAAAVLVDFRRVEAPAPTPAEREHRMLKASFEEWRKNRPESLETSPCDARSRFLKFARDFKLDEEKEDPLDWHPDINDQLLEEDVVSLYFAYRITYTRSVINRRRAGFRVECPGIIEMRALEDAWIAHLREDDEEVLRQAYITELREEIDRLRKGDVYDPSSGPQNKTDITRLIESLIEVAYDKYGITRKELGR